MNLELKNGAFFIADAHENDERQDFLAFLHALNEGQIQAPQLILMGDIFNMLVWQIHATHEFVAPYVNLLESIANKGTEVLYIEGNHDFNVASFFKKVKVFSLQNQPLILKCPPNLRVKRAKFTQNGVEFVGQGSEIQGKSLKIQNAEFSNENSKDINSQSIETQTQSPKIQKIQAQNPEFQAQNAEFKGVSQVALSHGDIFLPPFLAFVLKSLRNPFLLKALNLVDFLAFGKISAKILNNQKKKNLFYQLSNFNALAEQRYARYRLNGALVIEGHYHQNAIFNTKECKYINLPTFAYERSFFVVECD